MGKAKPKLVHNTEIDQVKQVGYSQERNMHAKPDLNAVLSNILGPFYFLDNHYPESDFINVKQLTTDLAPFAGTVGGGFLIGLITGYAIKKVLNKFQLQQVSSHDSHDNTA